MEQRRTKRFIDSAVQGALARRILIHWLIFSLLVVTVLPFCQLLSDFRLDASFLEQWQAQWAKMLPLAVIMLAMLPIFVLDTIRFSHRFAGPIFRFHSVAKQLAAGEKVEPVRLRKGDAWKEFADDFNAMVRRLSSTPQDSETSPVNDGIKGSSTLSQSS